MNDAFPHWLKSTFEGRLWIAAERLLLPNEAAYLEHIDTLAEIHNLPVVCSNDV